MTPLERSRYAAETADSTAEEAPQPLGPLGSARRWVDSTRENIQAHHGWTTGVGDCLSDRTSCCVTVVCEPTVMGQLVERIWRRKYSCIVIATVLWIGAVGNLISTWYLPSNCDDYMDVNSDGVVNQQELMVAADSNQDGLITGNEMRAGVQPYYDCQSRYYSSAAFITFSTLGGIFLCGMCCLTMLVRRHVRHRDNIPATVCAGLDDCLCATCCLPCAQCQIMRHEGLIGAKYKLFSPNGSVGFDGTTNDGFSRLGEEEV